MRAPPVLHTSALEHELFRALRDYQRALVAFSGGADSALVLAAAVRALSPGNVLAATVVSPSLATGEAEAAAEFALSVGVRHMFVQGDELQREGYRANNRDRCAFCKTELMDVLSPVAERELGTSAAVITGTNADDALDPHRPGIAAARARGAATPLADAGLTKADVRRLSRHWGLRTWDKPQAACLASRIAYGIEVSAGGLARIDRAEIGLRHCLDALGIPVVNLRVRDVGADTARIEVDSEWVAAVHRHQQRVREVLRPVGFREISIDPRGFRSGSMNAPTDK